jgi:hypothetical protein
MIADRLSWLGMRGARTRSGGAIFVGLCAAMLWLIGDAVERRGPRHETRRRRLL